MEQVIRAKLKEIEQRENVRILWAAESGSRAWGFASPDSDYDVRFIYVRPREDYLKLERTRDVIELPDDGVLDINGWDLDKTLRLLYKSNPTLFEWMNSPILYWDRELEERFRPLMQEYFSPQRGLYHYLSMAEGNFKSEFSTDKVKVKRYFYVLRPLLACKWILEKGTPPPVPFETLLESQLEEGMKPYIQHLLNLKKNVPEMKKILPVPEVNEYLVKSIQEIRMKLAAMSPEPEKGWDVLNRWFRAELERS